KRSLRGMLRWITWVEIFLSLIIQIRRRTCKLLLKLLKHIIIPERRFVEAINRQAYLYEMGDFPTEWEVLPLNEILKNENYREEMKQKIKDVSEKDKLLQAKEYEEGLVAEPARTHVKGHASAPYYSKKEPSQDPMSTANTFQPGSWMPPGSGSNHNK
uniref:Uncharacterized protein n=1 Tax=Bubo bubo TaxID=30461 RepID=A0A8C0FSM0_BUBBB